MTPDIQQQITLSQADTFLTRTADEVLCLEEGAVSIFIVSVKNGHTGTILPYCTVTETDKLRSIPSFYYRDLEHTNWRFQIRSVGDRDARLTVLPMAPSSVLKKRFLMKQQITTFEREGFEQSLVEYYKRTQLLEGSFIRKGARASARAAGAVSDVVGSTLADKPRTDPGQSVDYRALQFLCRHLQISLPSSEQLHSRCGNAPTLQAMADASGLYCRKVVLDENWYKRDCTGFIGTMEGQSVACIQNRKGQNLLYLCADKAVVPLTPELARKIDPQVQAVGRTLPKKSLSKKDIWDFCKKDIRQRDLVPYMALSILCALIGILLPSVNQMIYDDYIPVGNVGNLAQICFLLLTFMIGNLAFSIVKNLFGFRLTSRLGIQLQNAVYHRLFHLPEAFFREYDSADLAGRVSGIGSTASRYANTIVVTGISAVFSLFYLLRMFSYNAKLTWVGLAMYAGYTLLILWLTSFVHKRQQIIAQAESEASGKLFQYLSGVDKIRMAGAEEFALHSYIRPFSRMQSQEIKVNRLISIEEAMNTVIGSVFSMVLYWCIVKDLKEDPLSVGSFVAFQSAFGLFTGTLDALFGEILDLIQDRTELRRFWPVLRAVPEDDDRKVIPGPLSGGIALEHVSFSYDPSGKDVLTDINLRIRPGEYVGIVGASGCGKSTLLKLLLGFETPREGVVRVDSQDLKNLNKGAYRQQLGVVLQNGRLISGSIYENITVTAPNATMATVRDVIRQVGLEEDIAQMPMGIHTMLSENCGTISGGQMQRILIARAICSQPKILIFDEATSALDNLTQAKVTKSLDQKKITRIVVAHRLSTIAQCDRILVMDRGRIVEEGNYETLMARRGLFYKLAERQIPQ